MDKNIFNNLLSDVDTLQIRLKSYNSLKNELRRRDLTAIPSKIIFNDKDGNLFASFTLDSNMSREVLSLLIEKTKAELEVTAEIIKSMIVEEG
nr:MAG TPA: hypothetical protein [Caudoviricetes sp.]